MGWLRRHPELVILAVFAVVVVVGIVRYQTRAASPSGTAGDVPASSAAAQPTSAGPSPAASAAVSPAQRLADLDGDAQDVADYQAALDALGPKCTQDQAFIAGLGDTGYRDLVKNGVTDETRLSVLQHLSDSIPASLGRTDCTGILSGYLVLREQG